MIRPGRPINRSNQRITGRRWMQIRKRIAARDLYTCKKPGCGVITIDGEVDHIIPLHKGGTDDDSNLQYLCKPHHYEKTLTDQGLKVTVGADTDGWPLEKHYD